MTDKPFILKEGNYNVRDTEQLKAKYHSYQLLDLFEQQSIELFELYHPDIKVRKDDTALLQDFISERMKSDSCGDWICFPWNKLIMHSVNENEYFQLRTNRNKKIISDHEQSVLSKSCIGFAGLSIGSHTATSVVYSGIADRVKLAEFDRLETTNLNRVKAGIKDIGLEKLTILERHLYEINPYLNISRYPQGLTNDDLLHDFIAGDPCPQVIFEAIDDFKMKIKIRLAAREKGIPVIMFTNLGDNLMVDIERYDLDSKTEPFNGLLQISIEEILSSQLTPQDLIKYAIQIVGTENLPSRILESFLVMNKEVVGRPQLYGTVSISGGFAPYLIRHIFFGTLKSGRYYIPFNKLFNTVPLEDVSHRSDTLQLIQERLL